MVLNKRSLEYDRQIYNRFENAASFGGTALPSVNHVGHPGVARESNRDATWSVHHNILIFLVPAVMQLGVH
jgi:hypothetical protein